MNRIKHSMILLVVLSIALLIPSISWGQCRLRGGEIYLLKTVSETGREPYMILGFVADEKDTVGITCIEELNNDVVPPYFELTVAPDAEEALLRAIIALTAMRQAEWFWTIQYDDSRGAFTAVTLPIGAVWRRGGF